MKFIKIFLASSIVEFKQEREELGTFIRRLNNIYAKRDIYFELIMCEDVPKEIQNRRMQEIYNNEIRDSRYFYIIIGQNLGERSLEEFNIALESFQSNRAPRIWTYFYEVPDCEHRAQSVLGFMRWLDTQLGHDYVTFSHFDSVKLDFLMAMHQDPELQGEISFVDGKATLDGTEIMPLENVPAYGKNESLMALKNKKEKLDKQFAAAAAQYAGNPDDQALYQALETVSEERTRTADVLRQAERDLLCLCVDISKLQSGERQLTWREKEAIHLTSQGNYEAALVILRDKERKRELEHTVAIVDSYFEVIKGYVRENLLRIKALLAQGLNEARVLEIKECYSEIVSLALKYHVNEDAIYDYIAFLYSQHKYESGIQMALKLQEYYSLRPPAGDADEARLYTLLGRLYYRDHSYREADSVYHQAEEILQGCSRDYEMERIKLYNNMSDLYWTQHRSEEAQNYSEKALRQLGTQAEMENSERLRERAHAYTRLATLANRKWKLDQAEFYHRKALDIEEFFLSQNKSDDDIVQSVAKICSNLGIVYRRMKRYAAAEAVFQKSYELRRPKYETNPPKFALGYTITCSNYSYMLSLVDRLDEAEQLIAEIALPIKKKLMEHSPKSYRATYAISLYIYGAVLSKRDSLEQLMKADKLFRDAIDLINTVIEKQGHYTSTLAEFYSAYIQLLKKMDRLSEAEYYCRRNMDIYLTWDQRDPGYYEHEISVSAFDLADVLSKREDTWEEAREMYRKSLESGKRVMEYSARYYREEYIAAIDGLLAILPAGGDSQGEIEALNRERSRWKQEKEG